MVWQRSVQSVLHPGQHAIVVVMFFSHMESAMPREDNIGLPSLTAVTRAERGGRKGHPQAASGGPQPAAADRAALSQERRAGRG
jgi:hypothetical protein